MNPTDIEFDEFCDPSNPRKICYEGVAAAYRRIQGAVMKTPCMRAHMSEKLEVDLYLKLECLQFTGSFKERGVRNTLMLLSNEQKELGCITATTGNHGVAMSYQSSLLDIPCVVVMPMVVPLIKRAKCHEFGAKVIHHGTSIRDARTLAMHIRKDKRLLYVNGYDHPNVIEGQGTIGIEIVEQVPDVDAVLVPVGGGSLLAGICVAIKHLKPDTEIYGVGTDLTCAMCDSLKKNERTYKDIYLTIADGLKTYKVGVNTFHNVRGMVDKVVAVNEGWVARAIMHLADEEKLIVEGGGAVGVAALMAGLLPNLKGKKVVCVISGGNIDNSLFMHCVERAMTLEGRLLEFQVTVHDRPGGPGTLAEVVAMLAGLGVAIRECVPETCWVKTDVFSMAIKFVVETKGWGHTKQVSELVKKNCKDYYFHDMKPRIDKRAGSVRGPCLAPKPVCMMK